MFCPKCSAENLTDSVYCRQCGLSLTAIQFALEGRGQESVTVFEKSYKQIKVGAILTSIFSIVGLLTILTAIFNGTFSAGMLAAFVPALLFGLPLILLGTVKSGRALKAMKEQIKFGPKQINQIKSEEPLLLEVPPDLMPQNLISVTENTTRNLKLSEKTR